MCPITRFYTFKKPTITINAKEAAAPQQAGQKPEPGQADQAESIDDLFEEVSNQIIDAQKR